MATDPELMKLLVATFTTELEEQTQVMVDSLLQLEKSQPESDELKKNIDTIFRASHNIKGAARGIGIDNVGDIAHLLEDIFSAIRKKELILDAAGIDLVLDAVDKMRQSMSAYLENTPIPFNMDEFKIKLVDIANAKSTSKQTKPAPAKVTKAKEEDIKKVEVINKNAESVRVSIENIDRVSALMEEIQVNKISIDDHYAHLEAVMLKTKQLANYWKYNQNQVSPESIAKIYHTAQDDIAVINHSLAQLHQNFRANLNELSLLSNSLHEEIRRLRLIPASHLLQTLPRFVRNLSQELHKEIDLHIKGEDVKMDKLVLEGLHDPLIHLLRNAIDHGIEPPAERAKRKKPEHANLTIEIVDEGNEILIIFTDDGGGIDPNKITASALKKNLVSDAELSTMSKDDILQLIFRPGFSTKDIITNISGRGVGLDVVKSNLASLKGTVRVETKLGEGTTFFLRVPLTLTSERGLMVRCSHENYVLPTSSITRVMNIRTSEIKMVEGEEVIMLDHHPVILRSLAKILNLPDIPASHDNLPLIIIKKDWYTMALLVNEIIGEREIVVKSLQEPLNELPCVAGGTLSSTGQVILVLNIADIIHKGLNNMFTPLMASTDETKQVNAKEVPHILVVDDSITTRTLEQNVLENKGYKVTVAVNGKEAWDLIQSKKFSMLITDVNMPIMDGFELTQRVKQHEKYNSLPVIIVTSLGSDAEKRRGIEVGANAYIVKSEFESSVLLQTVAQLV